MFADSKCILELVDLEILGSDGGGKLGYRTGQDGYRRLKKTRWYTQGYEKKMKDNYSSKSVNVQIVERFGWN